MDRIVGAVMGGEFAIVRRKAEAANTALFEAEHRKSGRRCALRVLRDDAVDRDTRLRFDLDDRASSALESDHVVRVLGVGVDERTACPYIATELVEGETLSSLIARRGAIPPAEALDILSQLSIGLAAGHRANVVHGALRPENVLLAAGARGGAPLTAKIVDFGIGQLFADEIDLATMSIVSPSAPAIRKEAWMAPEQANAGSGVGPFTDVWALGLIAFYTLTGRAYWREAVDDVDPLSSLVREVLIDPLVPASLRAAELGVMLPLSFDAWFSRCVSREPAIRFAHADEARAELVRALSTDSATASNANAAPSLMPRVIGIPSGENEAIGAHTPSVAGAPHIPSIAGTLPTPSTPPRAGGFYAAVPPKSPSRSSPPAPLLPPRTPAFPHPAWVAPALGGLALVCVTAVVIAFATRSGKDTSKATAHETADETSHARPAVSSAVVPESEWITDSKPDPRSKTLLLTVTPPPKLVETFRTVSARVESPRLRSLFGGFALGGSGSGFALVKRHEPDPMVFVVTNRHVISESESVEVTLDDGTKVGGEVLYADYRHDVAVVGFTGKKPPVTTGLSLAPDPVADLDSVVATGYPFLAGKPSFQISKGEVRNRAFERTFDDDLKETYIQHSASIDPGSSGGPLLNMKNEVVGINTGFLPEKHDVFLALPASAVRDAVDHAIETQQMRSFTDWRRAGIYKACKELAAELASPKPRFRIFLQFISNRFVASDGFSSYLAEAQDISFGSGLANAFESDPMDGMRDALLVRVYGGVEEEGGVAANPCGDLNPTDAADMVNTPVIRMAFNLKDGQSEIGWTFEHGHWRVASAPLATLPGMPAPRRHRQ